jgi:hypothetical protein
MNVEQANFGANQSDTRADIKPEPKAAPLFYTPEGTDKVLLSPQYRTELRQAIASYRARNTGEDAMKKYRKEYPSDAMKNIASLLDEGQSYTPQGLSSQDQLATAGLAVVEPQTLNTVVSFNSAEAA